MEERLQQAGVALAQPQPQPLTVTDDGDAGREASVGSERIEELVLRQMRVLAGRRDVEELAQVAAEQVIRALPRFEGRSKLSTWTFRICYVTVRKHDRWARRWLRRFTFTDSGDLPEVMASAGSPDERVLREERIGRVRAALDRIPPKRRCVLILHDMEGLAVEEIATIVDAPVGTVRSRLRDGRKVLAALLRDDPYFGDEACRRNTETR